MKSVGLLALMVILGGCAWLFEESVECGRLAQAECDEVIRLVLEAEPELAASATRIVADHSCGPGESCAATFLAIVVLQGEVQTVLVVRGGSGPERVDDWPSEQDLPAHLQELLDRG